MHNLYLTIDEIYFMHDRLGSGVVDDSENLARFWRVFCMCGGKAKAYGSSHEGPQVECTASYECAPQP